MKHKEFKNITKNLQRDCSKEVFKEALKMYNITGVEEEINSDIILLESDKEDEFNIVCTNNDSIYLLNGKYGSFPHIKKCQIKESPNISIDSNGYKEESFTEINLTEYEDQLLGVVVREEQFAEDLELKEKFKDCSLVVRKTNSSNYALSHEALDKKLHGFTINMYDYYNWKDPILRNWYIENFVDYFTNNNLDAKLRNVLNENSKVLTK